MNLSPVATPKKPKARRTEFADAHRARRTATEREQLAAVIRDGWSQPELCEFARRYFFPNDKDYPTAMSYRRAVASIAEVDAPMSWRTMDYGRVSWRSDARAWRKQYRKDGSKPLPPRRERLLKRGRGLGPKVTSDEYAWPEHSEEFRSMIEQQARDYFTLAPELPLHPNAWAAAKRAHDRDEQPKALASRRKTESVKFALAPRKKPPNSPARKVVSPFDYDGGQLKPHFKRDFEGHTDAFREEVSVRARKDNSLRPKARVSARCWKAACHRHYVLTDVDARGNP